MTGDWNARSWHRFIYICGEAATFIPHSSFKRGVQPESKDAPSQEQTLIFSSISAIIKQSFGLSLR